MIVVNIFSLAVSTVVLFTCVFNEPVYDVLASWKKKKYERVVLSFCIVSFVLNVIILVYNGLKQSFILQTKPNRFLQISLFHRILMFIFTHIFLVSENIAFSTKMPYFCSCQHFLQKTAFLAKIVP